MSYFLNAAAFLIQTIFSFAIGLFLVRVLLLAAGASFYEAARLAKLDPKSYEVQYVETPLSGLEQLFLDMSKRASTAGMVRTLGPGAALLRDEDLERVRGELSWLQMPRGGMPVRAIAHCFCGL